MATQTQPTPTSSPSLSPEAYEAQHVHSVYEAIAPHFSSTRHKPWPLITEFLTSLPPGSVGLDVGCGNGKYLPVNPALHMIGSDRSAALVSLARSERRGEVLVADGLCLPCRPASVDFVISIAVVHHLSTRERRQLAIRSLLDCCTLRGRVMVYVWALEQSTSRRGWDEGCQQDTLVPWVLRGAKQSSSSKKKIKKSTSAIAVAAGDDTTQRQNEDVDTTQGQQEQQQQQGQQGVAESSDGVEGGRTYQRYYHLYKMGELEEDIEAAGGRVLSSGYEKDNWWAICQRSEQTDSSP